MTLGTHTDAWYPTQETTSSFNEMPLSGRLKREEQRSSTRAGNAMDAAVKTEPTSQATETCCEGGFKIDGYGDERRLGKSRGPVSRGILSDFPSNRCGQVDFLNHPRAVFQPCLSLRG